MKNLTTLLQHADPLRDEGSRLEAERERIRRTILATTPARERSASVMGRRRVLAGVVASTAAVVALGYYAWGSRATSVLAAVRLEVRLAEHDPVPGLVVAQTAEPGRVIYLHPEIVVSNDDIAHASVYQEGPGRFAIGIELLPSGADRMRQATAAHVGRPMAILIDGRVVMALTVRSTIGELAQITGPFTEAEANRIVEGIGR